LDTGKIPGIPSLEPERWRLYRKKRRLGGETKHRAVMHKGGFLLSHLNWNKGKARTGRKDIRQKVKVEKTPTKEQRKGQKDIGGSTAGAARLTPSGNRESGKNLLLVAKKAVRGGRKI